ncbi:CLUMA_CG014675, isoform A [Clunio marinus]|uniref:CLUMA_CG014675, isoform A n=1 Tax=Clunio marinus TaxID=568069 RepID=A0A1J1IPF2_9DIPT|nr:CLUMA_CG014675, isoform A [Clunio marinus]
MFIIIFLLIALIDKSFACNGYKLIQKRMENCDDSGKDVVRFLYKNSSLTLSNDCKLVPNFCIATLGYKTAMVSYKIWKNGVVILKGQKDMCGMFNTAGKDAKAIMKKLDVGDGCPFEPKLAICFDEKMTYSMDKFKPFMSVGLGGPMKTETKIEHDNGHSCFISEFELVKK